MTVFYSFQCSVRQAINKNGSDTSFMSSPQSENNFENKKIGKIQFGMRAAGIKRETERYNKIPHNKQRNQLGIVVTEEKEALAPKEFYKVILIKISLETH